MYKNPKEHAEHLFNRLQREGVSKYLKGQQEYKTKLWEYSLPWLIHEAHQEVIDQTSYVGTLRDHITELRLHMDAIMPYLDDLPHEAAPHIKIIREKLDL